MKKLAVLAILMALALPAPAAAQSVDVLAPPTPADVVTTEVPTTDVAPAPTPVVTMTDVTVSPAIPVVPAADVVAPGDVVASADAPAPDAKPSPAVVKPPTTDAEATDLAAQMVTAAQGGHWTLLAGLVLMMIVYLFNRLGMAAKIGTKAVPWVTVGLGLVGSVAYGLANGQAWPVALVNGLLMGSSAIAMWEAVIKNLTPKKSDGSLR